MPGFQFCCVFLKQQVHGYSLASALLMAYLVSYKCTAVAVQITNATCATAILDNYIIKSELVGLLWLSTFRGHSSKKFQLGFKKILTGEIKWNAHMSMVIW